VDELSATGAMTPMIDVVFLLLIFFVCAASGQTIEDLLPTDMPPAGSIEAPVVPPEDVIPKHKLWIYLSRNDDQRTVIELNDREYESFDELEQVLTQVAQLDAQSPVILDIDDEVPVGDMIHVYDLCRAAGYQSISFAAEPPTQQ
jgi:biopolymer transport protein ExbD